AVGNLLDPMGRVLNPLPTGLVAITLNEQGKTTIDDPKSDPDSDEQGDYVTALSITLLPGLGDANKVSLARSEVRAADEAWVFITSPENGAQIPEGDIVTVAGTAEPGKPITVTLDGQTKETTVGENGEWTVDFEVVSVGKQTAVANDGDDD